MGRSNIVVTGKSVGGKALRSAVALMVVLVGGLFFTGSAVAAEKVKITVEGETCFVDPYGPLVCPKDDERDFGSDVQADVLERQPSPPDDSSTVPFTGADITLFVITGAALVATGMVVVRRSRAARGNA